MNSINRAIIEVETLHDLLCNTLLCGECGKLTETRWQIEKQGNIVHERLNSLNSSLRSQSPPPPPMSMTDDLCIPKEQSDIEFYHYDICCSDKNKRARNIIKLVDGIYVDMLNTITRIRYNFNNMSKTQRRLLSGKIIDIISETFETRIKKYAKRLKEVGLSERQVKELNDLTEKRFLQVISVYIYLYAQNKEKTRNTQNSQRVREKHIIKLRKDIQDRKTKKT